MLFSKHTMYLLNEWAGRENIWPEVMVYGPSVMTESQIFSCPARPTLSE